MVTGPTQFRAQAQHAPLRLAGQGGLEFQPMPRPLIVQAKLDTGEELVSGTGGPLQPRDLASGHHELPLIKKMSQGRPDFPLPAQREAGDGQLARRVPLQPQAQPLQDQGLEPGFAGDQARREIQVQVQTRHAGHPGGVDRGRRCEIDPGRHRGMNWGQGHRVSRGCRRGITRDHHRGVNRGCRRGVCRGRHRGVERRDRCQSDNLGWRHGIDGARPVGVNPPVQYHLFQGQSRSQAHQPQM